MPYFVDKDAELPQGHAERNKQSSECNPHNLTPETWLLAIISGLILLSNLTQAGAHWPFLEGS